MRHSRPIRLAVQCPNCGRAPALRVFPREIEEKRLLPPDVEVLEVKCQWCPTVVVVTARAYHLAA